ncbi:hypothetical protein PV325_004788 [Microctonus aethiopoides]|nr:hypothetical protein PV326_012349 [Microctonus aethiopoides]KAK0085606.1 hypothetical protein PV325_004788 [Microctonus aethiopoides]
MNSQEPSMMTRKQLIRSPAKTLIYMPENGPRYTKAIIPLRLLIFVLTFILLSSDIYMGSLPRPHLTGTYLVFVLAMTTLYLFFDLIHIIGYFGDSQTIEYPMIFGSFVGGCIFIVIGLLIVYTSQGNSWTRMMALILSFTLSFLHTADVLLAIGYWRHKYPKRRKFGPPPDEMTIIGTGNGVGDGGDYPVYF